MARPVKQGIDYFPLEVDFLKDLKIRRIMRACGAGSLTILISLLSNIYRDYGYFVMWGNDMPFLIADEVGVSEGAVVEVVNKALQVNFFNDTLFKKFNILTSNGIQKRFIKAVERRKQIDMYEHYCLIDTSKAVNININLIDVNNNEVNVSNNQQSKEKESKEKDSKKDSSDPPQAVVNGDTKKETEKIDYKALIDTFNSICVSLPRIESVTNKRQGKIRTLIKNYGDDKKILLKLFRKTEASDYLTGRNGKWPGCGFDWIIEYNNAVKILDGNYDNERDRSPKSSAASRKSKFNNFEGRTIDYNEIERLEQEYISDLTGGGKS